MKFEGRELAPAEWRTAVEHELNIVATWENTLNETFVEGAEQHPIVNNMIDRIDKELGSSFLQDVYNEWDRDGRVVQLSDEADDAFFVDTSTLVNTLRRHPELDRYLLELDRQLTEASMDDPDRREHREYDTSFFYNYRQELVDEGLLPPAEDAYKDEPEKGLEEKAAEEQSEEKKTVFNIYHVFDVDGGYGNSVPEEKLIAQAPDEETAKAFCERFSKERVYAIPYSSLECGLLQYKEEPAVEMIPRDFEKDAERYEVQVDEILKSFGVDPDAPEQEEDEPEEDIDEEMDEQSEDWPEEDEEEPERPEEAGFKGPKSLDDIEEEEEVIEDAGLSNDTEGLKMHLFKEKDNADELFVRAEFPDGKVEAVMVSPEAKDEKMQVCLYDDDFEKHKEIVEDLGELPDYAKKEMLKVLAYLLAEEERAEIVKTLNGIYKDMSDEMIKAAMEHNGAISEEIFTKYDRMSKGFERAKTKAEQIMKRTFRDGLNPEDIYAMLKTAMYDLQNEKAEKTREEAVYPPNEYTINELDIHGETAEEIMRDLEHHYLGDADDDKTFPPSYELKDAYQTIYGIMMRDLPEKADFAGTFYDECLDDAYREREIPIPLYDIKRELLSDNPVLDTYDYGNSTAEISVDPAAPDKVLIVCTDKEDPEITYAVTLPKQDILLAGWNTFITQLNEQCYYAEGMKRSEVEHEREKEAEEKTAPAGDDQPDGMDVR